jgi:hypothetical protein
MTVKVLRGISTSMFFRLCCRAPRTLMLLMLMNNYGPNSSCPSQPVLPEAPSAWEAAPNPGFRVMNGSGKPGSVKMQLY